MHDNVNKNIIVNTNNSETVETWIQEATVIKKHQGLEVLQNIKLSRTALQYFLEIELLMTLKNLGFTIEEQLKNCNCSRKQWKEDSWE